MGVPRRAGGTVGPRSGAVGPGGAHRGTGRVAGFEEKGKPYLIFTVRFIRFFEPVCSSLSRRKLQCAVSNEPGCSFPGRKKTLLAVTRFFFTSLPVSEKV